MSLENLMPRRDELETKIIHATEAMLIARSEGQNGDYLRSKELVESLSAQMDTLCQEIRLAAADFERRNPVACKIHSLLEAGHTVEVIAPHLNLGRRSMN